MRNLLVRGGAVAAIFMTSLAVSSPAQADSFDNPPTDKIIIDLVAMAGSGCAPGTADVAVSPDNSAFTAIYSEYIAEAGPKIATSAGRKNCQLNVRVHAPGGFTYAVTKVDYRGYADLATGATATQNARYYFQGQTPTAVVSHAVKSGNWTNTDEVEIASVVWSPCGEERNLNINTDLVVLKKNSTADSFVAMDSTDGSIATKYHLSWKKCK